MSVKITGMEMPKSCFDCKFRVWETCVADRNVGIVFHCYHNRQIGCPLKECK